MSVTLDDIAALVNLEVGNTTSRGNAKATGDTGTTEFIIAPPFRTIIDDAYFNFYVDDVQTTGAMDFATGIYSTSEPYTGKALSWEFNYIYWTAAQVYAAANAGVGMMFPGFYITNREDIVTDGTSMEYPLTTLGVEELRQVTVDTGSGKFSGDKRSNYELDYDGDKAILKGFTAPAAGTLRASLVCRQLDLDTKDDALTIPDRAITPIVSYACYHLLNQKQAPRLRSDIALATVGGGNLSPRQMNDAANSFFLRYQAQMEHMKMRPWRVR
jgi:hypothetical protein